jgi:hypothetical protein
MPITTPIAGGTALAVKVVPGASRDRIVGLLGERLKIAVRQAPAKGAANRAACGLIAAALGIRASDVAVVRGQTRPEKTLAVRGLSPQEVSRRLGLPQATSTRGQIRAADGPKERPAR